MQDKIYVSDLIFKNNSADEVVEYIGENNIENIEMFLEPLDREHHLKTLEVLKRCEFKSISFHGPYRLADISKGGDKMWRDTVKSYEESFEVVRKYRGEFLVLHTNEVLDGGNLGIEAVKERIDEIVGMGRDRGVEVLVENVGIKEDMLFSQKEYTDLIVGRGYRALIDLGHAHINGWDMERLLDDLKSHIVAYHFHNNDGSSDLHLPLLEGSFKLEEFMDIYSRYTYGAKIVLELSGVTPKESLISSLKYLEGYLKEGKSDLPI